MDEHEYGYNPEESIGLYYMAHHNSEFLLHEVVAVELDGQLEDIALGIIMRNNLKGVIVQSIQNNIEFNRCDKECRWAK